ncbi:MAG: Jag N-terminal domain-containing protein [Clostridiales Family XIII bacterium]|jgi:spoIIIJ-associated protein|nr:Jag N-terminal domain-containing protein [Clostridiales Family XIII bacterium]
MEYSEKYGLDVDEAVRLALEELGLKEDQVMVSVLEEPTKGFLGLGQKLAKVRVEKIADFVEEDDLTQEEAISRAAQKPQSKATHDFRKNARPQPAEGQSFKKPERTERTDRGGRAGGSRDGGSRDGGRDSGGRDNRDGGGRKREYDRDKDRDHDRGRDGKRPEREVEIEIDLSQISRIAEPITNLVPDPESISAAFLADVIGKMNLHVEVEGFKNEEYNVIEITGEDARMAIGKRGQTLDALQYLTNLVANKDSEVYKRVIIDVEGYRSRREKTLEQLAVKLAKKVLKTGHEAKLEPMNPYERKVIHSTLQHVDGVTTKSEGEEPYRRVVIERE